MTLRSLIAFRGLFLKELRQIRADPRMIPVLVVAPVLQLLIFGYAATFDVTRARAVVADLDRSPASRSLATRVAASDSFELMGRAGTAASAEDALVSGDADVALVIPAGFGRALARGDGAPVEIVIDGTDSVSASVTLSGAAGLIAASSRDPTLERTGAARRPNPPPIRVLPHVLYNPEFKSRHFMVPGVLALVLLIVTMIATSMAIVREKELGTLEQLLVTPVPRAALVTAKLAPFACFGLFDAALVVAVARLWFEVPLRGSVPLLFVAMLPFVLCTLGLGLLVSTVSRTQQQAMMTALFLVMLPMIYFSGFVFPIESMPAVLQPFTEAVPLKHLLVIVRGVMLKGAGPDELWAAVAKLTAIGAAVFALAVSLFRKQLA